MIDEIKKVFELKDYVLYNEPYKMNIVGIRNYNAVPETFDDLLFVGYKTEVPELWHEQIYQITTDPGLYYLHNPINVDGTAILKEGQYINSHSLGLHRGKYLALVQTGNLTVIRDFNRDDKLDFKGVEQTGNNFGINIHKAGLESETVEKWSAGCQVFKSTKDFNELIALCGRHRQKYFNQFTYTLISMADLDSNLKLK